MTYIIYKNLNYNTYIIMFVFTNMIIILLCVCYNNIFIYYVCMCVYVYIHMYVYRTLCMYLRTYMHEHYKYVHKDEKLYVCMHVCMHVCVCLEKKIRQCLPDPQTFNWTNRCPYGITDLTLSGGNFAPKASVVRVSDIYFISLISYKAKVLSLKT